MEQPRIIILLATYNSQRFIREQIDSLLNQKYKNIQIFVSDDGSTDSTLDILGEYPQITLLKSPAPLKSACANFMFLLNNAPVADYYMFCDHDDVWLEDKVEKALDKMLLNSCDKPRLVHTDLAVADKDLNVISPSMFRMQGLSKEQTLSQALVQNSVTGCTVMINEPLRKLASKKASADGILMHDWFLNILALSTGTVDFVDEPLILYRQHGNNEVGAKDASSVSYLMKKAFAVKKNRQSIKNTYRQAQAISEAIGDDLGEGKALIEEYAKNLDRNYFKRLSSCKKHGFWKNSFSRKIGQILFL